MPDPVSVVHNYTISEAKQFLRDHLAKAKYYPQQQTLDALYESLYSGYPLLMEGPPGAGKTRLAEALAECMDLPLLKISCAEGIRREMVLYRWNREAQQVFLQQESMLGRNLDDIKHEMYTRRFLDLAPVAQAIEWAAQGRRSILVIDEIDKLTPEASDLFLEPFSEWKVTIEMYTEGGCIKLSDPNFRPIVMLTSNAIRHGVSSPLRNRALYTYIFPPTLSERIKILYQYTEGKLSKGVFTQFVNLVETIGKSNLQEPPSLRNFTRLAVVLASKNIKRFTLDTVAGHLCYIANNEPDLKKLESQCAFLLEVSRIIPPEIEQVADQLYEQAKSVPETPTHGLDRACTNILDRIDDLFEDIHYEEVARSR
ncbi:MAG: MoxR family ATPase [Chloracidobacterium sp.]